MPIAGPVVSSADKPDSHRESLDRVLDALVFAPLGLLLEPNKPSEELAAQGRRHLEAARLLGRMALGHPPAPTDSRADPPNSEPS